MKVGFIGAGRVGAALGLYLQRHGISIAGYSDRSAEMANKAAQSTQSKVYEPDQLHLLVTDSDIIFLAVQDAAIAELAECLAQMPLAQGKTFCHTSGALGADQLEPLRRHNGKLFSLHPLQAFSESESAVAALEASWFFAEGDFDLQGHDEVLKKLMQKLPNPFRRVATGQKSAYHAAAVVSSNYLMVLLQFSQKLMKAAGVPPEDMEGLMPLMSSAFQNYRNKGPVEALTGPIVRGDAVTVEKHLGVIRELDQEHRQQGVAHASWEEIYCTLGRGALDLALARKEQIIDPTFEKQMDLVLNPKFRDQGSYQDQDDQQEAHYEG